MSGSTAIVITLVAYKVALLAIGVMAQRRTKSASDFFLAGRGMGAWIASLSASASSSSAWTLLGVSGAAYQWGLSAIWIFPACVGGFAINWFLLARRLRRVSRQTQSLTVTELLAGPPGTSGRRAIVVTASTIVLVSLLGYVAAQFQGAGKTFHETFGLPLATSIGIGAAIVIVYTLLGGFWAVSITDSLQGSVMVISSLLLPVTAMVAVGGPAVLWTQMAEVGSEFVRLDRGLTTIPALGFVLGLLGIGLGYPGQPHVVNRFMALRDDRSVRRGRTIAMTWAVLTYAGMLVLGWCGRVLMPGLGDSEVVFVALTRELFSPVVAGIMIAAVLSAIMSTADSQLLVAGSSVSHDLANLRSNGRETLTRTRWVVSILSVGAAVVALVGSTRIFSRVLFAWTAMGAAFGPLLLVRVWRGPITAGATLAAMLTGFALAVLAYSVPSTQGTAVERCIPFMVAGVIAWWGSGRAPHREVRAGRSR